jgi:hypothetical protein
MTGTGGNAVTFIALAAIVGAVLLVRRGWEGQERIAHAGWALAAAALLGLGLAHGAWGLASGTVAGIATALALVAHAGWTSPAKVQRAPREAPMITLPRRWQGLVRRIFVFLLVVPVAFAAAQWLAFGVQALARRAGTGQADAAVLTLVLAPVFWSLLMAIQMTRSGPLRMLPAPAIAALLGTALWGVSLGGAA